MSRLDPETLFEGLDLGESPSPELSRLPEYRGDYESLGTGGVTKPCIELEIIDETPPFRANPNKSAEENNELRQAHYLERGEARGKIWQAMFICSQSPTGRLLLEKAKQEGCKLHISAQYDKDPDNGGHYHTRSKTIRLNTTKSQAWLVRSLGHELNHVQHHKNILNENEYMYSPTNMIAQRQAVEADSKAHEAQISYELFIGDQGLGLSNAPDNLLKFPEIWEEFKREEPAIAKAYASEISAGGAINGKSISKAHEAFYDSRHKIDSYQTSIVSHLLKLAQDSPDYIQNRQAFSKAISSSKMRSSLLWNDKPYVETEDFTDARHSGVLPEHVAKIRLIQEIRRQVNPGSSSAPFILAEKDWDIKTRHFKDRTHKAKIINGPIKEQKELFDATRKQRLQGNLEKNPLMANAITLKDQGLIVKNTYPNTLYRKQQPLHTGTKQGS